MRQSPAPFDMLRRPGSAVGLWKEKRGDRSRPAGAVIRPRWRGIAARRRRMPPRPRRRGRPAAPRPRLGLAGCLRAGLGVGQAQRLGQPARAVQQPLGLLGHVGLLQMVDELRRLLALGFAHRFEDARLRNPAEIVVDGRTPAGRRHVEVDGPGQLSPCANAPGRRFQGSFTTLTASEAQCANSAAWLSPSNAVRASQRSAGVFGQLLAPLRVPRLDRLGRRRCPPGPAPGR